MTKEKPLPDLSFAIHAGACCGQGKDAEFVGTADMSLHDRQELQTKVWRFRESADPEHGAAHDLIVNAANIEPVPEQTLRLMTSLEYQGYMQTEFLVLGIQRTLQSLNQMHPPFGNRNITKEQIAKAIQDKTDYEYFGRHNHSRGTAGNKAAFVLGRKMNQLTFSIRSEHNFVDVDIYEAAEKSGLAEEMQELKDGDNYYVGNQMQVFSALKPPDFSSEFYQTITDRVATYIDEKKDDIIEANELKEFLEQETFGQQYLIMLGADTADPNNRNMRWEEIIEVQTDQLNASHEETLAQS